MSNQQTLIQDLLRDVRDYAAAHEGRLYAPICHPAFSDIPYHHGPERFDLIAPYIPADAETALDIGSHWGYFAHRLEDAGLRVTAAEMNKQYLDYLTRIRNLCGKQFEVYDRSVFELEGRLSYDVTLALNIFHHFIKTKSAFDSLVDFLNRLDSKIIFFQTHNPKEGQMAGSFLNFEPDEFADFVRETAGMTNFERIGTFGKRPMYAIT